jgi:hypothetical protein
MKFFSFQHMHYLLKHKILQFVLNVHFSAPTCFGPLGPSSGDTHQNLVKVSKITVSLKYQLKHFVKIVVVWCMKISGCGVCSRLCVACVWGHTAHRHPSKHPHNPPQAEIHIRHTTTF